VIRAERSRASGLPLLSVPCRYCGKAGLLMQLSAIAVSSRPAPANSEISEISEITLIL